MPIRGMKSKEYLNFIGQKECAVTGTYPADLHHESIVRRFSGGLKKHFDYGVLPLEHEIHLNERHQLGKVEFWERYGIDPSDLVIKYLEEYIELEPPDIEDAKYALFMVKKDNGSF